MEAKAVIHSDYEVRVRCSVPARFGRVKDREVPRKVSKSVRGSDETQKINRYCDRYAERSHFTKQGTHVPLELWRQNHILQRKHDVGGECEHTSSVSRHATLSVHAPETWTLY